MRRRLYDLALIVPLRSCTAPTAALGRKRVCRGSVGCACNRLKQPRAPSAWWPRPQKSGYGIAIRQGSGVARDSLLHAAEHYWPQKPPFRDDSLRTKERSRLMRVKCARARLAQPWPVDTIRGTSERRPFMPDRPEKAGDSF